MGNTLIPLATFMLSVRMVLSFKQKLVSEGFFFRTSLLSGDTEADHPGRVGTAFDRVNLVSSPFWSSLPVSLLQVWLWRDAGAPRGRRGAAPCSTLVPSDGKHSQQALSLPINVSQLFIYFVVVGSDDISCMCSLHIYISIYIYKNIF